MYFFVTSYLVIKHHLVKDGKRSGNVFIQYFEHSIEFDILGEKQIMLESVCNVVFVLHCVLKTDANIAAGNIYCSLVYFVYAVFVFVFVFVYVQCCVCKTDANIAAGNIAQTSEPGIGSRVVPTLLNEQAIK